MIIELHDWLFPRSGSSANFLRVIAAMDRDFLIGGENIFSISHQMHARNRGKTHDTTTPPRIRA